MTHSGGCQCGKVRYRIEGGFGNASICHCRMCQKAFGSWGAPLVGVIAANLAWTRGQPAEFRSSVTVARGFCAACGTPLYMRDDGDPNYDLAIGTLDDPEAVGALTQQVGIESKLSWFDAMPGLPALRTTDYCSPADMERYTSLQHPDHDTEHWP
jgi:hypothetical protein